MRGLIPGRPGQEIDTAGGAFGFIPRLRPDPPREIDREYDMSIALQMTLTCTIKTTSASAGNDGDGQPLPGADVTVTGVICRFSELSRTELVTLEQAGLDNLAGILIVPSGTSIAMKSRVSAITNRQGVVEQAGPLEVVQRSVRRVGPRSHISCVLQRIKPAEVA